MSLFGAMNTAISGLTAQSNAFGNISDNVSNSQTVGYKRVDTNFIDYLTNSNATENDSGAVVARPDYVNNVQGTITQTDNPLGLAIAGQGFFAVSQPIGWVNNVPSFNQQQFYTRAGDFQMDKNGYLVNSAGQFLDGWLVRNGVVNQNSLTPIQVTQTVYNPVPTSEVTVSANLPATPTTGTATQANAIASDIDIYDPLGTLQTMTLKWWQTTTGVPNDWTVSVTDASGTEIGRAQVQFGSAATPSVADGMIGQLTGISGVTVNQNTAGGNPDATISFNYPSGGSQPITLSLGTYGQTDGVTQYAGTDYNLHGLTQNGVPPGSFSSVTTQANGNILVNYDNGQSRLIAQVPLITFNDPNQLQRQDGQSFTATANSGTPLAVAASSNGAGNLVTESVESSNVDIATEFAKLIVAQRAYTASTKMVTTADDLLQQTIDMKR
jgi:flagellar hook protein FlgE